MSAMDVPFSTPNPSNFSDVNTRAVFRINSQTNDQWDHLITEGTRGDAEDSSGHQIKDRPSFITYEQRRLEEITPQSSHSPRIPESLAGFKKLPAHLREKIWLETVDSWTLRVGPVKMSGMPGMQTAIVWTDYHVRVGSDGFVSERRLGVDFCDEMRYEFRWCGDLKLYQVCRESRQIASHCCPRSSTDLIPRSLLSRSHRVVLDMTPVAEWQAFCFCATHHRENVLDFAKYVRDTFYSGRHLTFSFLPLDDCVRRPRLTEKGTTHHLDGNWGGYNPLQHHLYFAVQVGLLEAFSGLSRKPTLNNKLSRPDKPNRLVPFPKLRTLELEWDPLPCIVSTCTQRLMLREEQVEEVQTYSTSRWPFWIRVDNDYVPKVRDIVPVLKSLHEMINRRPLIPLEEAYITTNPDKDGMSEAEDCASEALEGFHGRGALDDPLDDPVMWQTSSSHLPYFFIS
ncbi:hypothetical protein QBC37DRAFT_398802 [Rhypophila decipiens]|uniref:2EXR domain-containing protein n=1 Tax=Rhypophila decipiens TaxID=261697 RepID=A0AAN7B8X8_9PEZI|nr:hypothetical protein QBC37DRAFT_398802 [Rhypophila decipiens]